MAVNVGTGRMRSVRYCGSNYEVKPGKVRGQKQTWEVYCDGTRIASEQSTLTRVVRKIHEHACESGAYPGQLGDGVLYEPMLYRIVS